MSTSFDLVQRAFALACQLHAGQRRKSLGSWYLSHLAERGVFVDYQDPDVDYRDPDRQDNKKRFNLVVSVAPHAHSYLAATVTRGGGVWGKATLLVRTRAGLLRAEDIREDDLRHMAKFLDLYIDIVLNRNNSLRNIPEYPED